MEVQLFDTKTGKQVNGIISEAKRKDIPLKKDGWQFNWRTLYNTEGALIFKLVLKENETEIQGMLMLTLMYDEMLYMNNVEVAPHNIGSKGRYDIVAGCLIAFSCQKAIELGRGNYTGYLTFESKTELIDLYQEKYGATLAMGHKMFIEPKVGLELIQKYLNQ